MLGELDIPEQVRQVSFRHGGANGGRTEGTDMPDEMLTVPDHYLVEISSAKNITLDGYAVQVNYFYKRFDDFFSDRGRQLRFAQLASEETLDEFHSWLEAQPSFDRLPEEDQLILKRIRIAKDTKENIHAALSAMLELVPRERLIVTTHVDAQDVAGRHLSSRRRHISDVEECCYNLDITCYNPTGLMRRMGQRVALQNDGRDLTHFTEKFSDALFRDWNAHFFGADPLVEEHGFNLKKYARDIEAGDVFRASRELRAAVRQYPDNYPLQLELARLKYRLGDYASALEFYEERGKDGVFSDSDQEAWLVSTYETGAFKKAYELGEMLLADEVETDTIHATVARAAAGIGEIDNAISRWKHLFFEGQAPFEAASEVLDLLDRRSNSAVRKDEWVALVLERYPEHEDALAVLWRSAIAKRSFERLNYLLGKSQNFSSELAIELAAECCDAELHALGAKLLVSQSEWDAEIEEGSTAETLRSWADDRRSRWLIEGGQLLEAGKLGEAAQRISAAGIAGDARARQPMREVQKALLTSAREAYKAAEYEKVLKVVETARRALVEFREMHLLAGRSNYNLENYEAAVEHLLEEVAGKPFNARMAWIIARAAINSDQFGVAIDQLLLIADDESSTAEERADAVSRAERLVGRTVRQVRDLTAQERFGDAHQLVGKLSRLEAGQERAETERRRLGSALKKQIAVLHESQTDEQLDLARLLLEIDPENEFAAKNAALAALHSGQFETAIGFFEKQRPLTDNKRQVDRNIAKCQALLARKAA
ncbi:tetratricopeptide repeat protein [Aurantiacibacter rhizosphaerae]|uniref:Tetratricopeptide repeat protein n=1 Tax=Aurantiacibacter rhizosphaerae TaxID=2691582 RepID=A0A844X9Z6_9SPHN|nr:tetratricopeptide repeat protein [Aurantiacibacter rhizosphaerae]MWV26650.1 hypothetical protein [Aurantiacibacter rhizosphaerae]